MVSSKACTRKYSIHRKIVLRTKTEKKITINMLNKQFDSFFNII